MYGIVNKAIKDLVIVNFGQEVWDTVLEKSGVDVDFFISNEPYDDAITYKLASAISSEVNLTLDEVLYALGEWWVLKVAGERYSGMMESGGSNLKEFLVHLPVFHNRVMMVYPNLTPPEFKVSNIQEKSIHVHYHSTREGLKEFTRGILYGLGKMYKTEVVVEELQSRDKGASHELYKVSWD